jgi:catechol 2,3-dioxygenase-like lactoylglutathione lyase family enzyme
MPSKINHVAIMSGNYALLSKFYESYFGMKNSSRSRPTRAVSIGDGYVGMNINPRRAGRPGRLDHFGIQVDDVEEVFDRMRSKYPKVEWLKRPASPRRRWRTGRTSIPRTAGNSPAPSAISGFAP